MPIPMVLAASLAVAGAVRAGEGPGVHLLAPGFEARALPVRMTNVNNLSFAPDGRLYALTYDGRVLRLVDSDGDGLEDAAEVYWDRSPLQVPVGMAWSPEGIYVSAHGKVVLLPDGDSDGRADREEVVASGWPPTDVPSGGVDATGVTLDREGNLYFSLITPDYSNPYRLKDGGARFDVRGERGTVLRLSRDRSKREVVATGLRVPYSLRFNRRGDLFATDQEGETWLPGGNPLDELNHIVPGRHYGFPPRHETHLPGVFDEPPVIGFGPQHQSACGLVFNESRPGWVPFGPPEWEGDAFVTGFSRGKLWRARLVKTPDGYVGVSTLFAVCDMMVADVAISPSGTMYLACHSGSPDWGTGPKGEGKIFRIRRTDRAAPQVVAAWPAGPLEARVAFDRRVDPSILKGLPGEAIAYGESVRAADRHLVHSPPYKAVEDQAKAPRGSLRIASARLDDAGRTLVLGTDPHPVAATYALELRGVRAASSAAEPAVIDLDYDLGGVEASWVGAEGSGDLSWAGWWPHLDPDVARALTAGSAAHGQAWPLLGRPGTLTLRTALRPGPAGSRLRVEAPMSFAVTAGERSVPSEVAGDGRHTAVLDIPSGGGAAPVEFSSRTGHAPGPFSVRFSLSDTPDPSFRAIPTTRLRLPWAPPATSGTTVELAAFPAMAGGEPRRGEEVFHGKQARCSACHKVRGRGADVGPDLSNLVHRDAASVYRDITRPDAVVHPDYLPFTVALNDGRVLAGLVRSEGADALRVVDGEARATVVARTDVEELRAGGSSIMPAGLLDGLDGRAVADLLAFLVTEQKEQGPLRPPARSRAEVEAVLAPVPDSPAAALRPLRIVFVAGQKDHGPGEHDYPAWREGWAELLRGAARVQVETAEGWPAAEQWERADLVVLYLWNHDWSAGRYRDLDGFLARGKGVVAIHAAVIADRDPEALAERLGLSAQPVRTKYRHGPLALETIAAADNSITRGLTRVDLVDESYWPLIGDPGRVQVLATAEEEGKRRPMVWTFRHGPGRVFGSVPGHYAWTFDDPLFRIVLLRGMAWAAGEPPARFERLALSGIMLRDGKP